MSRKAISTGRYRLLKYSNENGGLEDEIDVESKEAAISQKKKLLTEVESLKKQFHKGKITRDEIITKLCKLYGVEEYGSKINYSLAVKKYLPEKKAAIVSDILSTVMYIMEEDGIDAEKIEEISQSVKAKSYIDDEMWDMAQKAFLGAVAGANVAIGGKYYAGAAEEIEGGSYSINGLKIIDDKVDGKIPTSLYEKYRADSVHNLHSDTMTLGKYEPTILADGTKDFSHPGPGAYTVKAGDTTYFSLGTEWDSITETYNLDKAGKNMFDYFNKPALDDAVKNNKIIRFSHNPESYGDCALKWEWDYLQEQHGYFALEKMDLVNLSSVGMEH